MQLKPLTEKINERLNPLPDFYCILGADSTVFHFISKKVNVESCKPLPLLVDWVTGL